MQPHDAELAAGLDDLRAEVEELDGATVVHEPVTDPPAAVPDEPGIEEPQAEPSQAELDRARYESAQAEMEHWRKVAGKHSGELGFLRRKLGMDNGTSAPEEIKGHADADPDADPLDEIERENMEMEQELAAEPDHERDPDPAPVEQPRAELDRRAVIGASLGSFLETLGADNTPEIRSALTERMRQAPDVLAAAIDAAGGDPGMAVVNVESLLERTFLAVKRGALETRRATSIANLDRAKKIAMPSGSGSATAPREQPRTLDQMSLAELDQAMAQETRGRW